MNRFTRYLRHIVYLEDGIDREKAAATIKHNIAFRGPNVIILACAILIASVGLNVNSIPVIIGAMLISPVMGPIIGFGLGLSTNDTELLKNSFKNFIVMVVISIVVASFYFLISPLRLSNPTELLARTRPTTYDVLIALFGGAAGMRENARKECRSRLYGDARFSLKFARFYALCLVTPERKVTLSGTWAEKAEMAPGRWVTPAEIKAGKRTQGVRLLPPVRL